jgi:2-polyprenyl-3-methyl-5-hydroxy-6-metoxy-1,4-benzoquinol methylase
MRVIQKRIYQNYVHAGGESLAPASVEGFAPRALSLCRMIRKYLPTDRMVSVLDLGCGHGAVVYFLRRTGYLNVIGVDVSPEQVAEATRLGIEGIHEGELLETLRTLSNHSQDVVIAFDVIEHFTKDELLSFVDEVLRVLKPDGRWIIHAPNGESPFVGTILYGDITHEQAFTRVSLAQLLLSSGFSRVECHESGPVPTGIKGVVRWVLWRGICLLLRVWCAAETGDIGRDAIFTRNLFAVVYK